MRRAIFCDESGISGNQKHYGFGALVMGYQRRGEFAAEIRAIRQRHRRLEDEIKWNKCSSTNLPFYLDLVDYFFTSSSLAFHCLVVERRWVNLDKFHDGDWDLARRKHFTEFLSNKITVLRRRYRGRPVWTIVYVDELPSSYPKAAEAIEIIGNRKSNKLSPLATMAGELKPIDSLMECDSKEYNGIQLCDMLLGAVVDTWNGGSTSPHKAEVKKRIAGYLGWTDLRSDTFPTERKFNIWWLTDQIRERQRRPVETRNVKLVVPLPPDKKYTHR